MIPNIKVIPLFTYGDHFSVISKFDIGLCFSENKKATVQNGSAKLFDYMATKLKIVSENAPENCYLIEKYNFGNIVNTNSKIDEFADAIRAVSLKKKNDIRYNEFLNDNNNIKRAKGILNIIE